MKVCLIAEGCYPYVQGGVSSWVQMLIEHFYDVEFSICTVATSRTEMKEYKYQLPKNVSDIHEIYINEANAKKRRNRNKVNLDKMGIDAFGEFVLGNSDNIDFSSILKLFRDNRNEVENLLLSHDIFDIAVEMYQRRYSRTVFADYLWNFRSMYLPFGAILSRDFPQADIYHSVSTGYAGIIGSIAKQIYKKPFIVTEHGIYTREREEEIIKSEWAKGLFKDMWIEYFYKLSQIAYDMSDRVITLFDTNKEIQVELGCHPNKIEIIPNGIDIHKFDNIPQKEDEKYIDIGAIVRIVQIKDIKTMILAFDVVKEQIPNARLFIMGPVDENKEYYEECQDLVQRMDIKDVYFTGSVKVAQRIGLMDILLLTSISEGQPLAVLEGMAAQKPHVLTNVGSCKELMQGRLGDNFGQAGIIVPVMNIQRIADAIILLCKERTKREAMGLAGRKRVEALYKKEDFLKRYSEVYSDMLKVGS